MRRIVILLCLLSGITPSIRASEPDHCQDPESAPITEPVILCGVNVITASRASVLRVNLPTAVTIADIGPGLDVEVTGSAPVAGFALVNSGWTHGYLVGAFPMIPPLQTSPKAFAMGQHDGIPGSETFPPGEYNLFLLADGSPVTVVLRLSGLSGQTQLSPVTPADYRGGFLPPRYSVPTGQYFSADRTEQLPLGGLGLRLAWVEAQGPGSAQAATCSSNTDREVGWFDCGGLTQNSLGGRFVSIDHVAELLDPGLHNQGGVAESAAATIHSVGVLAIWLGRTH